MLHHKGTIFFTIYTFFNFLYDKNTHNYATKLKMRCTFVAVEA